MATLSPNEIAGLIFFVQGWGPGNKKDAPKFLNTAIAVCLAESGGIIEAHNPSGTAGLWQIDSHAHAAIVAVNSLKYNHGTITNPYVNTASARDVYLEAGGWTPWKAYTNGKFRAHLGHGKEAYAWINNKDNLNALKDKLTKMGYPLVSITAEDIAGSHPMIGPDLIKSNVGEQVDKAKNAVGDWTSKIIDAAKQAGVTVGVFLLGALLLILGVWFLLSRTGITRKVPGPVGLVANAVTKK